MLRRIPAALLWYFAVGWGWNLVAAFAGLPSGMGPLVGLVAGAFILFASPRVIPTFALRSQARPDSDLGSVPGGLPDFQ